MLYLYYDGCDDMIGSRNRFNDEDYKYVSIITKNELKEIFESVTDEYNPNYSIVVLFKGKTYVFSIFTLEDKSLSYSIIDYRNVKSKDREFNSKNDFFKAIEELFLDNEFVALNDILYKDNEILYYPVTTNKYLRNSISTRGSEDYKKNLPDCYEFKTLNKVFSLLLVFMIANIFIGTLAVMYHVTNNDIILGSVAFISSIVSFAIMVKCYAFKTSMVNGLINSSKLLAFNKTYKFEDINYVENVISFNLFSTRKTYKIHMKDKRVVKIKYFNSSSNLSDDELKEMIIYLREMFITNKIRIKDVEVNNKLIIIIAILLYVIGIII